jgi:hypothetical protein
VNATRTTCLLPPLCVAALAARPRVVPAPLVRFLNEPLLDAASRVDPLAVAPSSRR